MLPHIFFNFFTGIYAQKGSLFSQNLNRKKNAMHLKKGCSKYGWCDRNPSGVRLIIDQFFQVRIENK